MQIVFDEKNYFTDANCKVDFEVIITYIHYL